MKNRDQIRERYMRDPLPIRLGGLAADLARIVSFSQNPKSMAGVESLLGESRAFINWSAPDLLPDRVDDAARLVEIGRGITRWYWTWHQAKDEPAERKKLAEQAQAWSDEILAMSGLLEAE